MTVFVFVHPAYTDQICYPQTLNVWESFERCGATVKYGEAIRSIRPTPGDVLVGYGRLDEYRDVASLFPCHKKWHYVVDESNSTTGPYEKAMSYMKLLDIGNIIVTYQNEAHLNVLRNNGIPYAIMPQTMPAVRPRAQKTGGVLLSGQLSESFYPVRTKLFRLLQRSLPNHVTTLNTPGQDISSRSHNVIRGLYYDYLDGFKMGVVCRAGFRDRFVAKYIEMGACHVLPIGDAPTYMPNEMKEAMINVENFDDGKVVTEIERLLTKDTVEYEQRLASYVSQVEKRYLSTPNMHNLLQCITK